MKYCDPILLEWVNCVLLSLSLSHRAQPCSVPFTQRYYRSLSLSSRVFLCLLYLKYCHSLSLSSRVFLCLLHLKYCRSLSLSSRIFLCFLHLKYFHSPFLSSLVSVQYRKFKLVLEPEKYLDSIRQKCFRDALVRLRLGISNINVHKNRYKRNDLLTLNNCPFCPEVEDEFHLCFRCHMYDDIRPSVMKTQNSIKSPYSSRG